MRNIILFIIANLFLSFNAHCQFAITASNIPAIGTTITYYDLDTTGAHQGNAGAAQFWDFSSFSIDSTETESYASPAGKPGSTYFPTANLVAQSGASYDYCLSDASQFTIIGAYNVFNSQSGSETVVSSFSDPLIDYAFPFNYNTTQTDLFKMTSTITSSGMITYTYTTGSQSATTDAYGTLKDPNGITHNVVRVKTVIISHDSTYIAPGVYLLDDDRNESYDYFEQNTPAPIISLTFDDYTSDYLGSVTNSKSKSLTFSTGVVAGINSNFISNETKIYPNPATDKLNVVLPDNRSYQLTLSDITGKPVLSSDNGSISVMGNNAIANVSGLSKGMYLLEIISDGEKGVKKIIVE
jgi:hypothetical protein